tara:strand:+ start:9553 stop:9801 length:249 start_codon:yes stop_codon:yes gene_type:complete
MKLNFYTTLGCHLCEQALQVVARLQATEFPNLELISIDIADKDDLVERYGIRIPVVHITDAQTDLGWPFDEEKLKRYLESAS